MINQLAEEKKFDYFYGEENNDTGPKEINEISVGTKFVLNFKNERLTFETNIIGKHNILNLSSMIILALGMGYSQDQINNAIKKLKMVKRRQEYKGKINGAFVIDDFAHHPTAIEKTLDAISNNNKEKKIIAIFEPASSTARSDLFQKRYAESLRKADEVIIIPPARKTTVLDGNDLDIGELAQELKVIGKEVWIETGLENLESLLSEIADDTKIILTLSNGKVLNLLSSPIIEQ